MPISKQQLTTSICAAFVAIAAPAIVHGQPMVYVALGSNQISVANAATNPPSVSMKAAPNSPAALALNASGTLLYVVSQSNNTVSLINTSNFVTEATLATGKYPAAVAFGGGTFSVANQSDNTVSIYSTAQHTLKATVHVEGSGPSALAYTPWPGHLLFVANQFSNNVTIIDTTNFSVVGTPFAAGSGPIALALSPNAQQVYVANRYDSTVTVHNTSGDLITKISGFSYPIGLAVDKLHSFLYVVNANSNSVSVVNLSNNQVVKSIPVGTFPSSVAVSADGTQVFVPAELGFSLSQISTSNNTVTSTTPIGIYPVAVAAH